ncbi:cupin domain-containing protein [Methylocella sp.]|uniref:cupin domain-containing protein n=1 Tax=Methylocella sp. TaxID=1978226 RepID=UPI003783EF49
MRINADFSQRVVVRPGDADWTASPQPGVARLQLDRVGAEVARATSLVRFDPGATFPHHVHGGGEEIFVVEGSFEDSAGLHRRGAYLRDPRGSAHQPRSEEGCLLFVKLWQFAPDDAARVEIDTASAEWRCAPEGFSIQPLHAFAGVTTFLVRLNPGAVLTRMIHPQGEEMLVLSGDCFDAHDDYPALCWVRDPGGHAQALSSKAGCELLVKTGHVAGAEAEAARLPG